MTREDIKKNGYKNLTLKTILLFLLFDEEDNAAKDVVKAALKEKIGFLKVKKIFWKNYMGQA